MFEETISVLRQEIRRVIKVSFRCYASLRTEGNHFQRLLKYDEWQTDINCRTLNWIASTRTGGKLE